ncbi:MAG: RHS repeat-associated core domain-containing protein [Thermogutta sp.]
MDQILAEDNVDNGADETVQWTLTDHLNTVRDIAKYNSQTGVTTVVNHLIYDAFGKVTSESNPAVDPLFLFTARPFDADTQLQNNLNRWYDARVGRWLSEDPIGFAGGDGNLYRYAGNDVLRVVDPSGNDWLDCMAACVEDNDPAKLAVPYVVKGLLLTFGAQDKTLAAWVFRALGQEQLADTILKMKRAPGQKEITNMLSVIATQLRRDAKLAKRILRGIGHGVTILEMLYGGALAYVEAYCCAYCTTRWWYGSAQYDPSDNIYDAVKRYYFSW